MAFEDLQFPRYLHKPSRPPAWVMRLVQNADECATALAEGWSVSPVIIGTETGSGLEAASHTPDPPPPPAPSPAADISDPGVFIPPRRRGWPKGRSRSRPPDVRPE